MTGPLRKSRLPRPELDTEGRRLFDAAVAASGKSEQDIAAALECTRGAVNNWRHGHASPEAVYRAAIEALFPHLRKEAWNTDADRQLVGRIKPLLASPARSQPPEVESPKRSRRRSSRAA